MIGTATDEFKRLQLHRSDSASAALDSPLRRYCGTAGRHPIQGRASTSGFAVATCTSDSDPSEESVYAISQWRLIPRLPGKPVVKPLYGHRIEVTGAVLNCLPFRWFVWSASLLLMAVFAVTLSATAPFVTGKTDETDGTCYKAALVTPKPPPSLPRVD